MVRRYSATYGSAQAAERHAAWAPPATGCSWLHAERTSPDRPPRSSASRPPDFRAALCSAAQPSKLLNRQSGSVRPAAVARRVACPVRGPGRVRSEVTRAHASHRVRRRAAGGRRRRGACWPCRSPSWWGCGPQTEHLRRARRAADAQCVPRFAGGGPARLRAGGRGAERLRGGPHASPAHPGEVGVAGRRHPYCQRWSSRRRCWSASRSGSGSSRRRRAA